MTIKISCYEGKQDDNKISESLHGFLLYHSVPTYPLERGFQPIQQPADPISGADSICLFAAAAAVCLLRRLLDFVCAAPSAYFQSGSLYGTAKAHSPALDGAGISVLLFCPSVDPFFLSAIQNRCPARQLRDGSAAQLLSP